MVAKIDTSIEWFRRVWAEEDEAAIEELFVPDGDAQGISSQPVVGPEGFKQFHRKFLKQFSDCHIEVIRHMEVGDWVSMMATLKTTYRANGERIEVPGQMWIRIVDGKIVEAHNSFDFPTLFEKAERLTPNLVDRLFDGEKLL